MSKTAHICEPGKAKQVGPPKTVFWDREKLTQLILEVDQCTRQEAEARVDQIIVAVDGFRE